ncbi:MAG: SAM-dependent methyltransferase [Planctomycetota bacterium]
MKLINEVTKNKLRGGYYTDGPVVEFCIRRVRSLVTDGAATWLEPSAGDGAFLRGLAEARDGGLIEAPRVAAVERNEAEAGKCAAVLSQTRLGGAVAARCFFDWAEADSGTFDAVVGNPPFVRYQFVEREQRELFEQQAARLGVELRGVSNLWIPFAIVSLSKLRPGGAFALVLPSEFVSTVSAGAFRRYLVRHFASLQVDLFPRDTFSELLQDVVVLSGTRAAREATARRVTFCEHQPGTEKGWKHTVPEHVQSWTRYYLTEDEVASFQAASELPGVHALGKVARVEVSIVTGANGFFTVDDATRREHDLDTWARPFLARTSDCPGIVFRKTDHAAANRAGSRAWLLDFSADRLAPMNGAVAYISRGEAEGLPTRYKCRIREPWYRVPHIKSGALMMTKRAHLYHRLLLNEAGVLTTDTIYRGEMLPSFTGRARDLVAGFQNTLTLLSTELEGRTYGGGVLELIPSEIARLLVPVVDMADELDALDGQSRAAGGQRDSGEVVRRAVDARLVRRIPGLGDVLPVLEAARVRLLERRHRT